MNDAGQRRWYEYKQETPILFPVFSKFWKSPGKVVTPMGFPRQRFAEIGGHAQASRSPQ